MIFPAVLNVFSIKFQRTNGKPDPSLTVLWQPPAMSVSLLCTSRPHLQLKCSTAVSKRADDPAIPEPAGLWRFSLPCHAVGE